MHSNINNVVITYRYKRIVAKDSTLLKWFSAKLTDHTEHQSYILIYL